jgi:hypothetical protein
LEHSGDIGPDLARMRDVNELAQWQDLCFDGDDDVQLCRQRLALLETWFLRVGRSGDFNAAVMNSARLVAATAFATRLPDQVRLIATIANARQADGREQ